MTTSHSSPAPVLHEFNIDTPTVTLDRACRGRKARGTPPCRNQAAFLALLEDVTVYIPRAGDLRLLQGSKPVLWFRPEAEELDDAVND